MATKDQAKEKPKAKVSPLQFIQQVRQELSKVTWPSRRETIVTTIMVFIMVALASVFFLVIDQILVFIVGEILNLR